MALQSDGEIRLSQIAAELGVSQGEFRLSSFINTGNFTGTKGMKRFYGFSSALFSFTTYTFSNVGITGRNGPSAANFSSYYSGQNWFSSYFSAGTGSKAGWQIWTIPSSGVYEIEVAGSRSGKHTSVSLGYGLGAIIRGRVNLTGGDTLTMIVGQYEDSTNGNTNSYYGFGGGGGTFVELNSGETNTLLFAAGGGGGSGKYTGFLSGAEQTGQNGKTTNTGGSSYRGEPGGSNGNGGASVKGSTLYAGGAGAGWSSSGQHGGGGTSWPQGQVNYYGEGGGSYSNGFVGGDYNHVWGNPTAYASTRGGFGGGGGGNGIISGGGGGGYSGGSAAATTTSSVGVDGGGGGGSYIISTATNKATSNGSYNGSSSGITNIGNFRDGAGYVKITKI